jgi:hypothetical protein
MITPMQMNTASQKIESQRGPQVKKRCHGLKGFVRWQIDRYRKAVELDRRFMTLNQHRLVTWSEAEADFIRNDTYGCAGVWRQEFCAQHCGHRETCELGKRFCG